MFLVVKISVYSSNWILACREIFIFIWTVCWKISCFCNACLAISSRKLVKCISDFERDSFHSMRSGFTSGASAILRAIVSRALNKLYMLESSPQRRMLDRSRCAFWEQFRSAISAMFFTDRNKRLPFRNT